MTGRRLFGIETEYAVVAIDRNGAVFPTGDFGGALLRAAERRLVHLHGTHDRGLFLANGSRVYLDAGDHPELAGPECLDPADAVRYLRAGDRLLLLLAQDVQDRNAVIAETRVFGGNVDYSGSGSTWGAHESYCHQADAGLVRQRLLPHLVTRAIFCGAGGLNPLSPGIEFTLSPRAHHLEHVVSAESTRDRGITHSRDEPLARPGYSRTHLICGENLRSDLGSWLKIATTALVVALIDGGADGGDAVQLPAPVEALRHVAADATCTRPLRRSRGGTMTAIEIQRHYLERARAHLQSAFMPPWAGDVCDRWSDVLDRLGRGPEHVSTMLDWAIKLPLYRLRAARRGFELGSRPFLREENLAGSRREDYLRLRRELFEIDTRWSQLGSEGLFEQLERTGAIVHHVPGVDRIDDAMEHPPAEGRARVRGAAIRRLAAERETHSAGWDHLYTHRGRRVMDLSDPFENEEKWSPARSSAGKAAAATAPAGSPPDGPPVWDVAGLLAHLRSRPGDRGRP